MILRALEGGKKIHKMQVIYVVRVMCIQKSKD